MTHDDRRLKDFEDRFRRWGRRPPKTSPDDAARRVRTRLPERRPPVRLWHGLAAAAVLALVVASWWMLRSETPSTASPPVLHAGAGEAAHAADADEVLLWLDESTPLYMTFAPSGQEGNDS